MVDPLVIQKKGLSIIGGHQRQTIALEIKLNKVPCSVIDCADGEALALNVMLNNPNAQGQSDIARLQTVMQLLLDKYKLDMTLTGYNPDTFQAMVDEYRKKTSKMEKDALQDSPPALDPKHIISRLGDIWTLGRHRLLCGDCTESAQIKKLMGGAKSTWFSQTRPGMSPSDWIAIPGIGSERG